MQSCKLVAFLHTDSSGTTDQVVARTEKVCEHISPHRTWKLAYEFFAKNQRKGLMEHFK